MEEIGNDCLRTTSSYQRGRRDIYDPFFLKGYQLSWREEGSVAIYCIEEGNDLKPVENMSGVVDGAMDGEGKDILSSSSFDKENSISTEKKYFCGFPGCPAFFDSFANCDVHYEEFHMFRCDECDSIFPSERLLDLHLQEAHDSFFATSVERHQAQFQCLVCSEEFNSKEARQIHLIERHKYPKWFRFTSNVTVDGSTWKKKQKWLEHHDPTKRKEAVPEMCPECTTNYDEGGLSISESSKKELQEKRAKRRERQSQQRAMIPCKFYMTKSGCWRGSKCMFLHSSKEATLDDLSLQFKKKAQVTVPDKISFGRRRRYF